MKLDPFSARLFVFCNRQRTLVKMVYWECIGFALWMKRLEKSRFQWPHQLHLDVVDLNAQQVAWLLDGYDLTLMQGHARCHTTRFYSETVALTRYNNRP